MSTERLNLPDSPRTKVFNALAAVIRNDPLMKATVQSGSLLFVDGDPKDRNDLALGQAPALRFTITNGPDEWWMPNSFKGPLNINVEMLVKGHDQRDVQNLWWALCKAIYPSDGTKKFAIQRNLTEAGAETGQARFTQPAYDPNQLPVDGGFRAMGQIQLAIKLPLNS